MTAWRGSHAAVGHADLEALAGELPELVAGAVWQAFTMTEGPHKRASAGVLAGAWYVIIVALLDHMRHDLPRLADPTVLPREIDRLRSICDGSGIVAGSITKPRIT